MAGRSARVRQTSHDLDAIMRLPEEQRRTLSHGDDTPRPPATTTLQGNFTSSPSQDSFNTTPSILNTEHTHHTTKRLGFLGEMLSSASGSSASTVRGSSSNQIPASRSHTRADSTNLLRESATSPTPGVSSSSGLHLKGHPSPSKVSETCHNVLLSFQQRN